MPAPFSSRFLDFPTEILLSIFKDTSDIGLRTDVASKNLCLSGQSLEAKPALPDPLNIASVCRRWRTIVLGAPELWSSFSFSLDSKQFASPLTRQWLSLYVARSKETAITVRVHGWYYGDHPYSREVNFFMSILSSCIYRWRELDIASLSLPQGWDSMAKSFFQLLDTTTCDHFLNGTEVHNQLQHNLRSLIINEPPYLPAKPSSPLTNERGHLEARLQHLTSLTIVSRVYFHRLWYCGILYRCSSTLTKLTIELLGVPDPGQYYKWNVLRFLQSLTIVIKWRKGNPQEALASIFSALVCPSLKKLEVRIETELPCVTTRSQWPGSEIVDFLSVRLPEVPEINGELEPKGGGLEEIVLVNVTITPQELEELRRAVPGTKLLVLHS